LNYFYILSTNIELFIESIFGLLTELFCWIYVSMVGIWAYEREKWWILSY